MKTCFLFPGQGAQYPGMGKDLWEESSRVKELFKLASDRVGMNLEEMIFKGTEEDLKATDKTQIAVTLISLSACTVLKERGIMPDGVAGFSLGEYAALYEAGVITLEDLFPIVKIRGDIMEKASRNLDSPSGKPGLAAVIGLSYDQITEIIKQVEGIHLALYNSPAQIVVAGTFEGLGKAETAFQTAGARKFVRLKVSGPFHCPLLEEARIDLEKALESYSFSDPTVPVYANVTGKRVRSGKDARDLCVKQIVSPVRWVEEEKSLLEDEFIRFVEAGPGTVLTGLWKYISKEYPCFPAGKLEDIEKL